MNRVYNFSAGPSMLPVPVLQKAQADLLDYHGSGMSVMEMSHRSKWFDEIIQNTEAGIRKVLNVPDNYKIGFFQGGATQQFAIDRKSTRLNSSHQIISYAVFCLKKKFF